MSWAKTELIIANVWLVAASLKTTWPGFLVTAAVGLYFGWQSFRSAKKGI